MPTVNGVEFPYTKAGMQKAKAWAEMTGKPVKMPKKKKSYAKPMPRKKGELKTRPIGTRPKQTGPTKATPMKYQRGGHAEFGPGESSDWTHGLTEDEIRKIRYPHGTDLDRPMKQAKNLGLSLEEYIKMTESKIQSEQRKISNKYRNQKKLTKEDQDKLLKLAAERWEKKRAQEDVKELLKGYRGLKPKSEWGFAEGGQIPPETLLRAMYALGGEIAKGRRMYGTGGNKKRRKK